MSYNKLAIIFDTNTFKLFKCKNLLRTLNVFNIPPKEHHLVYR